jgi:hypothetical protein
VLRLVSAEPNAFPDGPVSMGGKPHGFRVGAELGDPLTDNSRGTDAYRFHDAIHLGFMAVLGWSPTMRSLLRLKRKSSPEADECEDGARAIFAEEGLAAVLSRLAQGRTGFLNTASIDGDVIEVAKAAATGLEAEATAALGRDDLTCPTSTASTGPFLPASVIRDLSPRPEAYCHMEFNTRRLTRIGEWVERKKTTQELSVMLN